MASQGITGIWCSRRIGSMNVLTKKRHALNISYTDTKDCQADWWNYCPLAGGSIYQRSDLQQLLPSSKRFSTGITAILREASLLPLFHQTSRKYIEIIQLIRKYIYRIGLIQG